MGHLGEFINKRWSNLQGSDNEQFMAASHRSREQAKALAGGGGLPHEAQHAFRLAALQKLVAQGQLVIPDHEAETLRRQAAIDTAEHAVVPRDQSTLHAGEAATAAQVECPPHLH